MIVRPLRGLELLVEVELLSRFEEEDLQSLRGQHVGGHSAGRTGPDDDGVIDRFEIDFFRSIGLRKA